MKTSWIVRTVLVALVLSHSAEIQAQTPVGPGSALVFDGIAAQVQASSNIFLSLGSQLTFEAWIHPQNQACNTILSSGTGLNPATDTIFDVGWDGFICGLEMKVGLCIGGFYYSAQTIPLNAWTHVAVTCDGTNVSFYLNGVLDSTTPQTTSLPPSATPLYIGRQGSDCDCNFFDGPMDEVRIWRVARTATEISASMSRVLTGTEPGLMAYYRFDEGSGTTVSNSAATGTDNDGVAYGPGWTNSNVPFAPDLFTGNATGVAGTAATLSGTVNPGNLPTSVYFELGATTSYGSFSPTQALGASNAAISVSIGTTGLTQLSTYHYHIVASNSAGTTFGSDQTFDTISAAGGTWIPLAHTAPGPVWALLLLSDGTVLAEQVLNINDPTAHSDYCRLTPDINGSYVNGTWSQIASAHYGHQGHASAVLKDGRVFVAGGEYGNGISIAEVYDPITDQWTVVPVPPPIATNLSISDAGSMTLPDGRVLIAPVFPLGTTIIFDPATNSVTNGPATLGYQAEASWVKLPDESILTIDLFGTNAERFIPAVNQWLPEAVPPVQLYDPYNHETGPALLLPDGRAFFVGSTGHTLYYTPSGTTNVGTWAAGPDFPDAQGMQDAPAAMMVDGKVLCAGIPVPSHWLDFSPPTRFYEFDYRSNAFARVNAPGGGTSIPEEAPNTQMLDLPDGSVLLSKFASQLYVYKPAGAPLDAGKPTITAITTNSGGSFHLTGTQLNGISAGAVFGDDAQMDSNYPLVRLTNSGGEVYYCRTFNWSHTGVMTSNTPVSTEFTLPEVPLSQWGLVVVANGIASDPVSFAGGTTLEAYPNTNLLATGNASGPFSPNSANYSLTNFGVAPLTWTVGATSTWLTLSPPGGMMAPGHGTNVTVSLNGDAALLSVGSHKAIVWFTNQTDDIVLRRQFALQIQPRLGVVPDGGIDFFGFDFLDTNFFGGPFKSHSYSLTNQGAASMTWTAGTSSNWYSCSPADGTLAPGAATNVTVSSTAAANLLPVGFSATADVTFSDPTYGSAITRSFFFVITRSLDVSPADGLVVTGPPGGPFNPGTQNYIVGNLATGSITWSVGNTSSWFNISPPDGILASGGTTNVAVTLNAAAALLPYGDYEATLWFTNSNDVLSRFFRLQVRIILNGDFQETYATNGVLEPEGWSLLSGTTANNHLGDLGNGNYGMLFNETQTNAVLRQVVPTVPGTVYLLSFTLYGPNDAPNYFAAFWDNTLVYEAQDLGTTANPRLLVKASRAATALDFAGRYEGSKALLGLDDVNVVPVPATMLQAAGGDAGTLILSWPALPSLNYQLQYKTNLAQADWIDLGAPILATESQVVTTNTTGSDPARLFRVTVSP